MYHKYKNIQKCHNGKWYLEIQYKYEYLYALLQGDL